MKYIRFSMANLGLSCLLFSGCQGTLPTLGPLSMQNQNRVPPPGTGSYNAQGAYAPSTGNAGAPPNPSNAPLNGSRPLTRSAPIGTGIADAMKEESWHAIQDGKVAVASAVNNIGADIQNQVTQATYTAQNGLARVTGRLADETARIANELTPTSPLPATTAPAAGSLSDTSRPNAPNEEASWRKPQPQP